MQRKCPYWVLIMLGRDVITDVALRERADRYSSTNANARYIKCRFNCRLTGGRILLGAFPRTGRSKKIVLLAIGNVILGGTSQPTAKSVRGTSSPELEAGSRPCSVEACPGKNFTSSARGSPIPSGQCVFNAATQFWK